MFYILENNMPMVSTTGHKLSYWSKEDALQTIEYFDDNRGQYSVVNMVDYIMARS